MHSKVPLHTPFLGLHFPCLFGSLALVFPFFSSSGWSSSFYCRYCKAVSVCLLGEKTVSARCHLHPLGTSNVSTLQNENIARHVLGEQ